MKSPTPADLMPASGGSYIRNSDGSLTLQEVTADAPLAATAPEPAPEPDTAPKPAKPVKEA